MAAKIIYLDQNKWIALARSAAGPGDEITPVVEFVRAAKASGLAVFPLSAAHYMESNEHRDDDRYERLGRFMHELWGTMTMASPLAIIRHEIELAFAHALPRRIDVQPFSLLGKGVGHALDMPGVRFTLRDPEESILTGRIRGGERMPRGRPDLSRYNQAFVSELYDFRKRLDCGDQELRQRAVYANVMAAMLDQINDALEHHKIPHGVFEAMGMCRQPRRSVEIWTSSRRVFPIRSCDQKKRMAAVGGVGISRSRRDFQATVGAVCASIDAPPSTASSLLRGRAIA